jgi:hypothetical protein
VVCRRGREKLRVPVIDLPLPDPKPKRGGMDRCLPEMGSMEITDSALEGRNKDKTNFFKASDALHHGIEFS